MGQTDNARTAESTGEACRSSQKNVKECQIGGHVSGRMCDFNVSGCEREQVAS